MQTGIVKRFIDARGFGFITPDDGGDDVFTHISNCGNQPLPEGAKVEYQLASDVKRQKMHAVEVKVIG